MANNKTHPEDSRKRLYRSKSPEEATKEQSKNFISY
jgi:hypothetical protein